jgi:hypothetical protein
VDVVGELLEQRRFVLHLEVDDVDEGQRGRLARIVAALENSEAQQIGRGNAEALGDRGGQGVGGVVEGKPEFGESQHGGMAGCLIPQMAFKTTDFNRIPGWGQGLPEQVLRAFAGGRGGLPLEGQDFR